MAGRRLDVLTLTEAEESELTAMASRPKTAHPGETVSIFQAHSPADFAQTREKQDKPGHVCLPNNNYAREYAEKEATIL
jgi:hypothetical protein